MHTYAHTRTHTHTQGRNTNTIQALDKEFEYITFEQAIQCASNEELHPTIRSRYVELMISEYSHTTQFMMYCIAPNLSGV